MQSEPGNRTEWQKLTSAAFEPSAMTRGQEYVSLTPCIFSRVKFCIQTIPLDNDSSTGFHWPVKPRKQDERSTNPFVSPTFFRQRGTGISFTTTPAMNT